MDSPQNLESKEFTRKISQNRDLTDGMFDSVKRFFSEETRKILHLRYLGARRRNEPPQNLENKRLAVKILNMKDLPLAGRRSESALLAAGPNGC